MELSKLEQMIIDRLNYHEETLEFKRILGEEWDEDYENVVKLQGELFKQLGIMIWSHYRIPKE